MTRRGAPAPVRISREAACAAERIIRERTDGADLEGTPFPALHDFAAKLKAALRRRRPSADRVALWNLSRDEVESGYRYLMLFSHQDVPGDYLTTEEFEAVNDVAIDLGSILAKRRGNPGLTGDQVEERIDAFERPDTRNATLAVDERFARRLKKKMALEHAFWSSGPKRPSIPPHILALLARSRNTEI